MCDKMINLDVMQEYYSTNVLIAMGENIIKETALAEYTMEAADSVNVFRRAIDFFSRVINRFIGWIRKGQLTRAKKTLEDMKKNPRYSTTNTPADHEHLSTMFWDMSWLNHNVLRVVRDFNNSAIVKMVSDGHVKALYDRNANGHRTAVANSRRQLREAYERMTAPSVRMVPLAANHKMIDNVLNNVIDYAINDVYDNLVKTRSAIRVIRDAELHEKQLDDSRNMAQQYAHVMTILGECFVEEMRIVQAIANMLIHGARKQASSLTRENDQRRTIIRNITLNEFFEEVRAVFNQKPAARTSGIWARILDENDPSKCRIELYWVDGGNTRKWYISCKKINDSIKNFIARHDPIMPRDIR